MGIWLELLIFRQTCTLQRCSPLPASPKKVGETLKLRHSALGGKRNLKCKMQMSKLNPETLNCEAITNTTENKHSCE